MSKFLFFLSVVLFTGCTKIESLSTGQARQNSLLWAKQKTNIIIILADDIGYEVPTYTGGSSYATPNIDKLAKDGMQFMQCYASPMCSPSRMMMMTGKYNFRNYYSWGKMPVTEKTIANMMQDAGYATCVSGKWQLDGGDTAIHNFGFDKYMVWAPYYKSGAGGGGSDDATGQYKNPKIYVNGDYLPDSVINGKYGEDFFRQYLFDFIDSNISKPFFALWTMNLCHKNFSPTPDDPEFAAWDPHKKPTKSDTIFFPSMVKYMDKQVGMLIQKLQQTNLTQKTIVFYLGDNGTPQDVHSTFQGQVIQGQKGITNYFGTHVPLIAYMPGSVKAGSFNDDLIDFTDFLPTMADIARRPLPDYGTLDGKSFGPALKGIKGYARDWVYCYFYPHPEKDTSKAAWVNNKVNKLYDDDLGFVNIPTDPFEQNPIPYDMLTPNQKRDKDSFEIILSQLHN